MKTIDQLETAYQNAWERFTKAEAEYQNAYGSEIEYYAARSACLLAAAALNAAIDSDKAGAA